MSATIRYRNDNVVGATFLCWHSMATSAIRCVLFGFPAPIWKTDRLRLGQTVLETSSTSEGATTNGSDDGEHESEDDPADPTEGLGGSEGIAVEVPLVAAAARELVRESGGSGEPEEPSEEEPDTVAGN